MLNANCACLDAEMGAGHARRKTTLEPTQEDVRSHNRVAASGLSTIRKTKVGTDGHAMVECGFLQEEAQQSELLGGTQKGLDRRKYPRFRGARSE
jgi:hypothetical protein